MPLRVAAGVCFNHYIKEMGIDYRCLNPEIRREVVESAIGVADLAAPSSIFDWRRKEWVAKYMEVQAYNISLYISQGLVRSGSAVEIFKRHQSREDYFEKTQK